MHRPASIFIIFTLATAICLNLLSGSSISTLHAISKGSFFETTLGALSLPVGISPFSEGGVWVDEAGYDSIVHLSENGTPLEKYALPVKGQIAWVWSMVEDTEGGLWVAIENLPYLFRLNISTGQFTNVSLNGVRPYYLAIDDTTKRLYFSSFDDSSIGYLQLNSSHETPFIISLQGSSAIGAGPAGLSLDRKGHLFVADSLNSSITEFTSGLSLVKSWPLPASSEPVGIAFDSNRNILWFTNHASSFWGYLNLTDGRVTEFSTSAVYSQGVPIVSLPYWIFLSKEGEVWFNEHFGNRIARFDFSNLTLTEFNLPENDSSPLQLSLDKSAGKVWFTEFSTGKVGYILMNTSLSGSVLTAEAVRFTSGQAVIRINTTYTSALPELTGTLSRDGILTTNVSIKLYSFPGGYQVILSSPSMNPGKYTLTACIMSRSIDAEKLTANTCSITYLYYEPTSSSTTFIPVLAVLAFSASAAVLALGYALRRPPSKKKIDKDE